MKYQYSYSRLRMYRDCPQRFKIHYVDGITLVYDNKMMEVGKCFHVFIEKITQKYLEEGNIYSDNEWGDVKNDGGSLFSEGIILEAKKLWRWFEQNFIQSIRNSSFVISTEYKIGLDQNLKLVDFDDKSVFFRGIIDRIDIGNNEIRIIDYKTGWKKENDALQGAIYIWLLSKIMDIHDKYITVSFMNVRYNEENSYEIEYKGIQKIEKTLFKTIAQIENDTDFLPNIGENCEKCDYVTYCQYANKSLALINDNYHIVDHVTAQKAGELVNIAEARIKQIKENLKEYVKKFGDVATQNGTWTIRTDENREVDAKMFHDIVLGLNGDPFECLKVDNTKLNTKKRTEWREASSDFTEYKKGAEKLVFERSKNDLL